MKLNHDFIRSWIRYFGVGLFVFALVYKFKKILSTKPEEVNDDEDAIENPKVVLSASPNTQPEADKPVAPESN